MIANKKIPVGIFATGIELLCERMTLTFVTDPSSESSKNIVQFFAVTTPSDFLR